MGHYLSDFEGPPFKFSIECKINKKQKSLIRQKFFKKKERIFGIKLNYESITDDENRKWFEIEYNPTREGENLQNADSGDILKVLGEKYFLRVNKNLEKRRDELLKPYLIKRKTIEGIISSAPIIKSDQIGINQMPNTTIKIKEGKIKEREYGLLGAHFLTAGQKIKLDIDLNPDSKEKLRGYSLLNNQNKEILRFEY